MLNSFCRPSALALLLCATALPLQAQTPSIAPNGILNAADYSRDLAPGTMVALFGTNLAPKTTAASAVPLPKTLEGVSVELQQPGGTFTAVPLYFVSPGQINIQLPFFTATTAQVRVRNAVSTSAAAPITLTPRAPRIFTRTMDGKGEPILFHAKDFSWVSTSAPAFPGEYLSLLLTGLGAVSPAKEAGAPGGDNGVNGPLNLVADPVFVSIGGIEVAAIFAGLMPGFPGVYQVNFQVPEATPAGLQALQLRTGTARSQASVATPCARYAPGAVVSVVSPSGATITTTGASINLPAGLFSEPTTVAVSRSTSTATPVETWRASDVYTVTGLPATLNVPVTVKIDLTRTPGTVATLMAMSSGRGVRGSGLEFLEAELTSNQATIVLPAAPAGGATGLAATVQPRAESGAEISLYVMTYYRSISVGSFLLFFPADTVSEADVNSIAAVLEQTKSKLVTLGLNWDRRTRWPMRVVIYPFASGDSDKWGMAEPSILGLNYHSISLNASKLSSGVSDDLKATVSHELFHILQNLYDPRDAFRIAKVPGSWLWFQEAASTWFESVAAGDPNQVPAIVRQDNYAFLSRHGLEYQPGDPTAVQNHGYGATIFLHYLAAKAGGNTVVGNILKEGLLRAPGLLANSARWPVEGTASVLPGMLSEHWRNFVIEYAEGSLYGGTFPDHSAVISQFQDRHAFTTETTAGKTFSWNAPALSAAVYTARFDAWPKDVKLSITLADPGGEAQLSVYRVRSGDWTLITRMRAGEFDFPKPEELAANRDTLILIVANANGSGRYTGTTNIEVGVNKTIDSILPFLRTMNRFSHHVYGVVSYPNQTPGANLMGPFFGLPGVTWSGNKFSIEVADSALVNAGDPPYQVTFSGTMTPDGLKVASAHYKRYRLLDKTYTDSAKRVYRDYEEDVKEWDLTLLPVKVPDRGFSATTTSFIYEVKSAASASVLSGFVCKKLFYNGLASEFTTDKLKTISCSVSFPENDRLYIELTFYK